MEAGRPVRGMPRFFRAPSEEPSLAGTGEGFFCLFPRAKGDFPFLVRLFRILANEPAAILTMAAVAILFRDAPHENTPILGKSVSQAGLKLMEGFRLLWHAD